MTIKEMRARSGVNLNTGVSVLTLLAAVWAVACYVVPLKGLPADVEAMKQTQIMQTETMRQLVEVAADAKVTRREVDRHDERIQAISRRVDALEMKR